MLCTFICTYFGRTVDDIIFYSAKFTSLFLFVRITFVLPFSWRYPHVIPGVYALILDPLKVCFKLCLLFLLLF
jgi:hypothetical protein